MVFYEKTEEYHEKSHVINYLEASINYMYKLI
jgi:hypothetical protein